MKIAITGANGLLGWHTAARLHAKNCAAGYAGNPAPYQIVQIDHTSFEAPKTLTSLLCGVDAIIHFAGVNRGADNDVETANPVIAQRLIDGCVAAGIAPTVVYANSTHAAHDTPYGRSKRIAGEHLAQHFPAYIDLVLPHIFGETARPYYNNVTATLVDKIIKGETPDINPTGSVSLLHAGDAAELAIQAATTGTRNTVSPAGHTMSVQSLFDLLLGFHNQYEQNIFPNVTDSLHLNLFNCYRCATYPRQYPKPMLLNADERGVLYECAKSATGSGGQTFLSTTRPGVTRGDHFHLHKVERFLVVKGNAIRKRKVLTDKVVEFPVSGDTPVAIDMVPLHTHSIENTGDGDLYTLFWTHELFDPYAPDTYADPVLEHTES